METDEVKAVAELMKTIPGCSRIAPYHTAPHVEQFLSIDSPLYTVPRLESPPLFSRDRNPGHLAIDDADSNSKSKLDIYRLSKSADILKLLPKEPLVVEEPQQELHTEHMAVIDGWSAFMRSRSISII